MTRIVVWMQQTVKVKPKAQNEQIVWQKVTCNHLFLWLNHIIEQNLFKINLNSISTFIFNRIF